MLATNRTTTSTTAAAATRVRILEAARVSFAACGYGATTNRIIAGEAGVTTGSIYYHFASKLDLYCEVFTAVQRRVYDQFSEAAAGAHGVVAVLEAVFVAAIEMNRNDPSLAAFLAGVRIDADRDPEVAAALGPGDARRSSFFEDIIERAVVDGELPASAQGPMGHMVRAFAVGLVDGYSHELDLQREAVDGLVQTIAHVVEAHLRTSAHPDAV